ncbi:cytochrome P450 [Mycena capillaripes]|nr:cytochrome P450 [Mycena capillaripes]
MIQILLLASNSTWTFIITFSVLGAGALRWKRNRAKLPLPPGPKQLPLVGNLFDIPSEWQWETYLEWSKQLNSDIIYLNAIGTSIVVLSSMDAVKELLERRSSLYSDRPTLHMLLLMGWDFSIGIMKYGDRWRSHRKLVHEAFNVTAIKQFRPQVQAATHELLRRLVREPRDIMGHFRHMAGALIMDVTYGIGVHSSDDPYIHIAKEALHGVSVASVPGAFLVDIIPALKYVPEWVPGAGFQRKAREWRKVTRDLMEVPFAEAKRKMVLGTSATSFTSLNLRNLDDSKDGAKVGREEIVKASAANMYGAGSDTTVSALGTFILAMLANPEAQRKAQAEIDSVVGTGQLPDFADEDALPYVSAVVKEVLRWKIVTPIAIPHYLAVEDEYRGYRIPAGSVVVGNAWAILNDEEAYPEPQKFNPQRFLLDGKLNPAIRDPDVAAFGFGRRVCPGKHMAAASLWITIASILSTFNINKLVDEDGNTVEPSYAYCSGFISTPLPFECSITPRSSLAVEVVQSTASGSK